MSTLVHPGNPMWRVRLHPTSRLFQRSCVSHGRECIDSASLVLHHYPGSWTVEERDAHPAWCHDFVYMCESPADGSHQCDDRCALFEPSASFIASTSDLESTLFDEIAYFHGSENWDLHWESDAVFSLHPALARLLDPHQLALVAKHLRQIAQYYAAMESAGFFSETESNFKAIFSSTDTQRPRYPISFFGAGFSGFDRLDERGWDRAGYQPQEGHSPDDWELRSSYQIAYFVALGRIFQVCLRPLSFPHILTSL
ncbi:hypothetical protein C8R43DRAFT_1026148 [Mycena crocata]|nr:hypothetical protein C8R43DRAFT_1026148 [Mycena crocata]